MFVTILTWGSNCCTLRGRENHLVNAKLVIIIVGLKDKTIFLIII